MSEIESRSVVGDASEGEADAAFEAFYNAAVEYAAAQRMRESARIDIARDALYDAKDRMTASLHSTRAALEEARGDADRRLELVERTKQAWDEMWGGDNLGVLMDDIDREVSRAIPSQESEKV